VVQELSASLNALQAKVTSQETRIQHLEGNLDEFWHCRPMREAIVKHFMGDDRNDFDVVFFFFKLITSFADYYSPKRQKSGILCLHS
jgi:hypothetical protein